jgi:hypothetical protein
MIEVITMKDESNMSEKMYSKDAGISTLMSEWIPISLGMILVSILMGIVLNKTFLVLTGTDPDIKWYIYSLVGLIVALHDCWRRYRLIKRELFASVSVETLMLRFGKDLFLWKNIQKVSLEGDRKLIITLLDKGETKRRLVDLQWLLEKENFINTLKDHCTAKNIPYHQSEPRFFSQIELFLDSLYRYPHS